MIQIKVIFSNTGQKTLNAVQLMRQRACQVPKLFFPIMFGVQLVLITLLIPYVFIKCRQSKATARLALQLNFALCISYMLYCILNFVFNFVMNSFILFIFLIHISLLSSAKYIEIFSFISPLTAAAMKPVAPVKKMMCAVYLLIKVSLLIPLLIASINYGDPDNPQNDAPWNYLIMIFTLISSVEVFSIALFLLIYARRMLQFIDDLSIGKKNNETYSKIPDAYLQKIKAVILRVSLMLPPVAFMLFFTSSHIYPCLPHLQQYYQVPCMRLIQIVQETPNKAP